MVQTDKVLRCVDCGAEFVWSAGEQAFFAQKQLKHEPRRCRACKARREARAAESRQQRAPVETEAVCSVCGRTTTVPFRPGPGRPVYCRSCYQRRRARVGARS